MVDDQNAKTVLSISLVLFAAIHLIPVLTGGSGPWGLDQLLYFSKTTAFVLAVFAASLAVPKMQSALGNIADAVGRRSGRPWHAAARAGSAISALTVSVLLLWRFRNATHFLGDGYLWAGHLLKTRVFNEPVSSWLYRGIYQLLNGPHLPLRASPVEASAITSVICAVPFLVFAYKTAALTAGKHRDSVFVMLALLSNGMMMLFFGYVETYPVIAVGVMTFVYFGIKYIKGLSGPAPAVAALLITVLLHFSAIALLPGCAVLFWTGKRGALRWKRYFLMISICVIGGLAVLWILQGTMAFSGFFHDKFLPLFAGTHRNRVAYPLFSLETIFDLFNEIVLVCPIFLFIVPGLLRRRGERDETTEKILMFLATTAIFYVLEFLVFNENIGVSRDWDLFSPLAVPLALMTALILIERFPGSRGPLPATVLAVIIVHTAPWILLNADRERSELRFVNLVEAGYWSDHARGYGYSTLGTYYSRHGKTEHAIRFTEAASNADRGNVKLKYNLASLYDDLKDYPKAIELYTRVIGMDPDHLAARNNLGVVYMSTGDLGRALEEFSEITARDSSYVAAYKNLAYIYLVTGRMDECLGLFETARDLDPGLREYYRQMGTGLLRSGETRQAREFFERLSEVGGNDAGLHLILARIYLSEGDDESALSNLEAGIALSPGNPDIGLEYGLSLFRLGRRGEAVDHLTAMIDRGIEDGAVMRNAAVMLCQEREFERAKGILERAVELYPADTELRIILARCCLMLNDTAGSSMHVREAQRLGADIPHDLREALKK